MADIAANIVKIGNSRGIRIPKAVLEQVGLSGKVVIRARGAHLEIRPATHPRDGWEERFQEMSERGADHLLDDPAPTKWDEHEWTW